MPIGGTNYKALIAAAADAFGSSGAPDRFLIVLSDGGATDEDWRPRVGQREAEERIKVIAPHDRELGIHRRAGLPCQTGPVVSVKR